MIKLVIYDLDGTLTKTDTLDLACALNGKGIDSIQINQQYIYGNNKKDNSLAKRIALLKGLSVQQISSALDCGFLLRDGAFDFVKDIESKRITQAICSGNITPIVKLFANYLGVNFIHGMEIEILNGKITGKISSKFTNNHKYIFCNELMAELGIRSSEVAVFGDSKSDIEMMKLANYRFFVNPKNNIETLYQNSIVIDNFTDLMSNTSIQGEYYGLF